MRNFAKLTLVLLLTALANVSLGQNDSNVPASAKEFWSHLIGNWDVKGHVGPRPVEGVAHFEWANGKHSYIGQQVWTRDDGTKLHLALLGGWDPQGKATVEQGFSSSGDAARVYYRVSSTDAAVMEGTIEGVNGRDAPFAGDVKLERIRTDEFRLTTTIDGQLVHSLTYVRQPESPQGAAETKRHPAPK